MADTSMEVEKEGEGAGEAQRFVVKKWCVRAPPLLRKAPASF